MILGLVKGNVVSTVKQPSHEGFKLMVVQPVNKAGIEIGTSFLAHDSVQAGVGDMVLVAREGNAARQILGSKSDPFHAVILGIVDEINLG